MTNGNGHDNEPLNIDKLVKIAGMTTSDNDNQCLVAIRTFNQILKQNGWDWDKLLRGKVTIEADPFAGAPLTARGRMQNAPQYSKPQQYNDKKEIQQYFDKLSLKKLPSSIQTNVSRIERIWEQQGYLIFKDYDFLKTTANSRRRY